MHRTKGKGVNNFLNDNHSINFFFVFIIFNSLRARESYRNRIRAIYFSNFNEDAILPEKEDHNKSEVQVDDAGKKRIFYVIIFYNFSFS